MKKDSSLATVEDEKHLYNPSGFERPTTLFDNLIWVTTEEAAEFLRKSSHALRQMVYAGKLRPRKVHGRLYFKKGDLEALIESSFY